MYNAITLDFEFISLKKCHPWHRVTIPFQQFQQNRNYWKRKHATHYLVIHCSLLITFIHFLNLLCCLNVIKNFSQFNENIFHISLIFHMTQWPPTFHNHLFCAVFNAIHKIQKQNISMKMWMWKYVHENVRMDKVKLYKTYCIKQSKIV